MNQTALDANLAILERQDPALTERLRAVPFDGFAAEVATSKTGLATARIQSDPASPPVSMCSAYDPVREAARWAETVSFKEPSNVIVYGAGLGHHLNALLKRHGENIRFFFIIERDLRILKLALSVNDLRNLNARNGVVWIVGEEPRDIPDIIGERRTDIILHNCKMLDHDPSAKLHPDYYAAARKHLVDAIAHDEINLRTTFESRGRNQFNLLMNMQAMAAGYPLKPLENLFKGWPAIVTAAGPSLDKNVNELARVNDRALIVIVDTAQTTFKRIGVQPDVVVTGDPTPLNFSHFEEIDSLGDSFLAFHPECCHKITQKYIDHPYLLPMFDGVSELAEYVFDAKVQYGETERQMNVGHLALSLTRMMGCDPIILAGFDYAFPKEGGTTHASAAAVSRRMHAMREDQSMDIEGKEGKANFESGTMMLVPGYHGDMVPTTPPFQQYIIAIEKDIERGGATVIDATEGGARFEGAVQMPLSQALDQYLNAEGVAANWAEYKKTKPFPPIERSMKKLAECKESLITAKQQCIRLHKMLTSWQPLIQSQVLDPSRAQQEWQAFDKVWLEMVESELFNYSLGDAVQYLYYRRQRQAIPKNESPNAFLECMFEKYDFILNELAGLLDNYIQCFDLSMQLLAQRAQRT